MFNPNFNSRALRTLLLTAAAATGLTLGACNDDDGNGEPSLAVRAACEDYCERRGECNEDVDQMDCRQNCEDAMGTCMADAQDAAIDQLEMCANEDCNDLVGCSIDAGAQCLLDL